MAIILIDMDGVVCDLVSRWCEEISERCVHVRYADVTTYWLENSLPPSMRYMAYKPFEDRGFYLSIPPVSGARRGIEQIKKMGHEVYLVTAPYPAPYVVYEKCVWVDQNLFPVLDSDRVIVTQDKSMIRGDLIVDDRPRHLESFPGHAVLFGRRWNREARLKDDVFRLDPPRDSEFLPESDRESEDEALWGRLVELIADIFGDNRQGADNAGVG